MKKKKILAAILSLAMAFSMSPVTLVSAASATYLDESGLVQTCDNLTSVTSDDTEWTDGWYIVEGEVTISTHITVSGNVNLILADDSSLTVNGGIGVGNGNSITIWGQENGTGSLSSVGDGEKAAIGGDGMGNGGNITINGGNVNATGGSSSAGIGNGGNITINGGNVNATGGSSSAGIGQNGGINRTGMSIRITGGNVNASGGSNAAGIGGGYGVGYAGGPSNNFVEKIEITGGNITAIGSNQSSGIGNGNKGGCQMGDGKEEIILTGGVICASGGSDYGIGDTNGYSWKLQIYVGQNGTGNAVIHTTKIGVNNSTGRVTYSSGILFNGNTGTIYGTTVTPTEDLEIPSDCTLTIPDSVTLTIAEGAKLIVEGSVVNNGSIINYGTITGKENITGNGTFAGNEMTTVNYSVAPTYTVTIPATVELGETATISASDVVLVKGKQVEIALTGTSEDDNAFKVKSDEGAEITYTVKNGENEVAVGSNVLIVNPTDGKTGKTTLSFSKPDTNQFSGEYTGTVTFTVSVADA